jgi:regulator of RNase E activity RraA
MRGRGERFISVGAAGALGGGERCRWLGTGVRPVWTGAAVAGPAFTLETIADDNLAFHRAVSEAPAGCVIVAAAGGVGCCAVFGEVLCRIAVGREIAGLVTDCAVRDVDAVRELGFPVFAGGVSPLAPRKSHLGRLGGSVSIAGVAIEPGDWLVADGDGVVAIPAAEVDAVLAGAEAARADEEELVRRALAGVSTLDQLGLR